MENREPGFYWVQRDRGAWEVAQWYKIGDSPEYDGGWLLAGTEDNFTDSELDKIDENRITRE